MSYAHIALPPFDREKCDEPFYLEAREARLNERLLTDYYDRKREEILDVAKRVRESFG